MEITGKVHEVIGISKELESRILQSDVLKTQLKALLSPKESDLVGVSFHDHGTKHLITFEIGKSGSRTSTIFA
jgi:hypothetical protein